MFRVVMEAGRDSWTQISHKMDKGHGRRKWSRSNGTCGAPSDPFTSEDSLLGFERVRVLATSHWGHIEDDEAWVMLQGEE